jgi:hypothetical protein
MTWECSGGTQGRRSRPSTRGSDRRTAIAPARVERKLTHSRPIAKLARGATEPVACNMGTIIATDSVHIFSFLMCWSRENVNYWTTGR